MRDSFSSIQYQYDKIPAMEISENFGIYVNIPFCKSFCSFCPFYKEYYKAELLEQYVTTLIQEISASPIHGAPYWIYFGGGTPNLLSISQLGRILTALKEKVTLENVGVELSPKLLSKQYLDDLKSLGVLKISVGVESFAEEVLKKNARSQISSDQISELVTYALNLGLFVNIDMMVGLSSQDKDHFIEDIKIIQKIKPTQITIYPYMVVRGKVDDSSMPDADQFFLIEESWKKLKEDGYQRRGPWTFTLSHDLYDSSRDELVDDYVGFGAGAFSTYAGMKIVNPEVAVYLKNIKNNSPKALIARQTEASKAWRNFAKMVADLEIDPTHPFPFYIKANIFYMKLAGYIRHNKLTPKGLWYAHFITKTIVQSLPFPLQNPDNIDNFSVYQQEKDALKN